MTLSEAIDLIRPGITTTKGIWADIGAGTGLFTEALIEILEEGKVYAIDKNPHSLYQSKIENRISNIPVEILEANFNLPMSLPPLDGILMANALHYANDHLAVLKNVLCSLKPGGTFILIEYDTDIPNPPWVPHPISSTRFLSLCHDAGLTRAKEINRKKSIYRDGEMYVTVSKKN